MIIILILTRININSNSNIIRRERKDQTNVRKGIKRIKGHRYRYILPSSSEV